MSLDKVSKSSRCSLCTLAVCCNSACRAWRSDLSFSSFIFIVNILILQSLFLLRIPCFRAQTYSAWWVIKHYSGDSIDYSSFGPTAFCPQILLSKIWRLNESEGTCVAFASDRGQSRKTRATFCHSGVFSRRDNTPCLIKNLLLISILLSE